MYLKFNLPITKDKILQRSLSLLIFMFIGLQGISQNEQIDPPIIYAELFGGGYGGESGGILWGSEVNYQIKKNLLTLRYTKINDIGFSNELFAVLVPLPVPVTNTNAYADEVSLLYGRRKIINGHSISLSIGPSYNFYSLNNIDNSEKQKVRAFGAAFETNIKWFKKEKKNPFGFSYGAKLSGNISKNYYIGLSAVVGLGWHKKYISND